ncbi:hypothetical protein ST37_10115 [Vibrio sp. qd031]|uniref:hypothetical protein n=1 Tax=Vibrio sp. qd031 TaxID=1603038 RepID=UPI000A116F7B|nr:hypothetical protein [Vibrio sp. qd031]ORT50241.1 hypothetical protein ST37_10115 [Vibrio sp. qd031]
MRQCNQKKIWVAGTIAAVLSAGAFADETATAAFQWAGIVPGASGDNTSFRVVPGDMSTDFNNGMLLITETTPGAYNVRGYEMDFKVQKDDGSNANWQDLDEFDYSVQRLAYAYGASGMISDLDNSHYTVVVDGDISELGENKSYKGNGRVNVPIHVESVNDITTGLEAGVGVAVSATLLITQTL